jgi:hypothetical protein
MTNFDQKRTAIDFGHSAARVTRLAGEQRVSWAAKVKLFWPEFVRVAKA